VANYGTPGSGDTGDLHIADVHLLIKIQQTTSVGLQNNIGEPGRRL
jgi:hypothetical protein